MNHTSYREGMVHQNAEGLKMGFTERLLSFYALGRHQAAKRSGVKWALYSSVVIVVSASCSIALFALLSDSYMQVALLVLISRLVVTISAIMYGIWWAIGISANPFNHKRGCRVFVQYALLFFTVWLVCSRVVLNRSPLGDLL
jgi:hypothetical protein